MTDAEKLEKIKQNCYENIINVSDRLNIECFSGAEIKKLLLGFIEVINAPKTEVRVWGRLDD